MSLFQQTTTPTTSPDSKRRKFTPSSSFGSSSPFNNPSLFAEAASAAPSPAEIESDLLQVGMRIRKSVNDGYKTPGRHAFTPRPFFNSTRLSPETLAALESKNKAANDTVRMPGIPISRATFCGISLAALSHLKDDYSEPSQSFASQQMWTYSTSSKRSFQDSSNDDVEGWSDSDESSAADYSMPRTPQLMFADQGNVDYFNIDVHGNGMMSDEQEMGMCVPNESRFPGRPGRKLAKPRSRARLVPENVPAMEFNPFVQLQAQMAIPQQQEQQVVFEQASCGINMTVTDFDEAPFLQKREDVEMDCS